MNRAAVPLLLLAAFFLPGCATPSLPEDAASRVAESADTFTRSPYRLVGHVLAVDRARGTAIVDLAPDAPASALCEGAELVARTRDLHPAARLAVTRYLRGRTLGVTILAGDPAVDDEVVWHLP